MRTTIVFFAGVIASILVAAAAFRGGTPVDYTFTYQGQLRNAGALVNGPVDLRITLWDSDVAGGQVGAINNYQAVPITEGRFALGLNFGATAFDGSNRWVQLEFRSPAGSGQYLTLNPRDKIMATPYAMFALNGGNGIWNYNAENQSVSVLGQKVGIGTSTPTALLEVVGTGGDDSVKLPAGSVGLGELGVSLPLVGATARLDQYAEFVVSGELMVNCPTAGWLLLFGSGYFSGYGGGATIDGLPIGGMTVDQQRASWHLYQRVPVSSGPHVIRLSFSSGAGNTMGGFTAIFFSGSM